MADEEEYMRPSDIRFTHDSIQYKFRNGGTLADLFRELLQNGTPIENIPKIEVMQNKGIWFAVRGNRRLFVYQELESRNQIEQVQVTKKTFDRFLFNKQYTSKNEGRSVKIRSLGEEAVKQEFSRIWAEHKQGIRKCNTIALIDQKG